MMLFLVPDPTPNFLRHRVRGSKMADVFEGAGTHLQGEIIFQLFSMVFPRLSMIFVGTYSTANINSPWHRF